MKKFDYLVADNLYKILGPKRDVWAICQDALVADRIVKALNAAATVKQTNPDETTMNDDDDDNDNYDDDRDPIAELFRL